MTDDEDKCTCNSDDLRSGLGCGFVIIAFALAVSMCTIADSYVKRTEAEIKFMQQKKP